MNEYLLRFGRLMCGLVLYAAGIVMTLKANIGYAPWDVFHAGLSNVLGIGIGLAGVAAGITVVGIAVLLGEKVGLGTLFSMVFIGVFIDMFLAIDGIPKAGGLFAGIIVVTAGLFTISLATFFYMGTGFGAGPRDSLMVAFARKTGFPIGACKSGVELCALLMGLVLGGMVGMGTVIAVFLSGFCIQTTFGLLKFKPSVVKHETLSDTYKGIRAALSETGKT